MNIAAKAVPRKGMAARRLALVVTKFVAAAGMVMVERYTDDDVAATLAKVKPVSTRRTSSNP